MCYEELILNNPHDSIINKILKQRKAPSKYQRLMISKIAEFTRSMIMSNVKPIFIITIDLVTYVNREVMEITIEEINNQVLNTAIKALGKEEDIKVVHVAKFAIDKLENVKTKIFG